MGKLWLWLAVQLCVLVYMAPASAATDEVAELRAAVNALKSDYEARIAALEARIAELETAGSSATAAIAAPVNAAPAQAGAGGGGAAAFNPAISLILAGHYAQSSADPESYRITGFVPAGDELGPGPRGFNLGESEITIAANVDPWFMGNLTASLANDNSIAVEEAYFRTLGLQHGLVLKGGRFFSGLGYLNEVHAHAWDFVDQPLVYQALFGSQLTQDGLQLKWLAPTTTFIELGAEAGNGSRFPATTLNRNGLNSLVGFAHVGGDAGDSASWRVGLSVLDARAENRSIDADSAFTGTSRTWGGDFTYKWSPHGDATRHQLKLQGEYFHRVEDGQLVSTSAAIPSAPYYTAQSGWYLQGTWLFYPRWRMGLRYDELDPGAVPALETPRRSTVMLDWSPSEFSRLRAQYALDDARGNERDRQLQLQYLFAIGAHGAHKF
jgi:hypothetical protein